MGFGLFRRRASIASLVVNVSPFQGLKSFGRLTQSFLPRAIIFRACSPFNQRLKAPRPGPPHRGEREVFLRSLCSIAANGFRVVSAFASSGATGVCFVVSRLCVASDSEVFRPSLTLVSDSSARLAAVELWTLAARETHEPVFN